MNHKERFLAALAGEDTDRPSVFSANQTATGDQMEAAGAEWPEAHQKAGPMADLAAAAYTEIGFDAVRVPYCQTMEAEALGSTVKYGDREYVPRIDVHSYGLDDSPHFPEDFLSRGRIPQVIEAVRLLKSRLGDEVAVGGNVVGPFSIVANLLGITNVLKASIRAPDKLQPFLEVAEQAGTELGKAYQEAGADFLIIEDMMASIDVISPPIFKSVAQPWEKRQIENLPDIPTIIHICGAVNPIGTDIADTGATGISVEPSIDAPALCAALQDYDRHIPLIGGVDAVTTLFTGSPDDVKADVRKALDEGYSMIAPGCSVPPASTIAKLRAMVEAVQ